MIPGIVASAGIFQPNGPTQWTAVPDSAFPGGPSTNWQYLSSNPDTGAVVISGLGGKFFRSIDYGNTWTAIPGPGGEASFLRIGGWVTGLNWIAQGNTNSTYMTSADDGATWTARTFPYTASGLTLMFPDPSTPGKVYGLNNLRLFVSTDSGVTFGSTPIFTFAGSVMLVISPVDGTILALQNGQDSGTIIPSRYLVSTDGGVSWSTPQTLMANGVTYNAGIFNGTYWIIGSPKPAPSTQPLKYSTDLTSWTDITSTSVAAWAMGYNSVDSSTVVVGDATVTPLTSRQSVTTWVASPVTPPVGVSNPTHLKLTAAGSYWLAAGSSGVIRAPRAM